MTPRLIAFPVLLVVGVALITALLMAKLQTQDGATFAPLFTVLGSVPKAADRAISKVVPATAADEAAMGEVFAQRLNRVQLLHHPQRGYVTDLTAHLSAHMGKPFLFRAFILDGPPNAFALPGGIVVVSASLLKILHSEAELAGVLGHEIGHIALGHCFDAMRFEILAKKLGASNLGDIADALFGLALHASWSKTQEAEADEFGYAALIAAGYDPGAMGRAFASLAKTEGPLSRDTMDPVRDYFSSHPEIHLRAANYTSRAEAWRARNPTALVYLGVSNYAEHRTRYQTERIYEWTLHPAAAP